MTDGAEVHAAPRRRRRWPWITLLVLVLALVLVAGSGLWYISGLIGAGARVDRRDPPFPMTITSAQGSTIGYVDADAATVDSGLMGIATIDGGYVQTTDPQGTGSARTRIVTDQVLPPTAVPDEPAALDGWYFPRNPKVGLGLDYEDVAYDGPLGPTPAWLVPGTSSTWVVFTHGRGATPLEGLRMAQTVSAYGYPMLLIRYRDDAKAPVEDGLGNFGATEWHDLEAAVQYALDHGAEHVVLAGASMGGAITLAFLQNSPLADRVVGAFLDAPVTDFGRLVELNAQEMGLPALVTAAGMQVARWRYGFDWAATDYTAEAAGFTTPILIVQGTDDATVPAVIAEDFAAAANPADVQIELFAGADHVRSWNVDRARYVAMLTGFLNRVGSP